MKNKVIIWDAEFKETAPKLKIMDVYVDRSSDNIFAEMDLEQDSIMREIGAR